MSFKAETWHTDRDRCAPFERDGMHLRGEFHSWREWVRYCDQPTTGRSFNHQSRSRQQSAEFVQEGWRWAVDTAYAGWQSPIAQTDASAREVAYGIIGDKVRTFWEARMDVTGETFDVGMVLSGEPECFLDETREDSIRAGDVVRLVVPVTFNCDVDESLARERGTAIVALIDILRAAGFGIEVWAHMGVRGAVRGALEARWSSVIQVQRASDPLDMGTIMYAVAHPTMLRRLGLSALERVPSTMTAALGTGFGYGYAAGPEPRDLPVFEGATITLPLLTSRDDWSEGAIGQWIIATLDTLSGE